MQSGLNIALQIRSTLSLCQLIPLGSRKNQLFIRSIEIVIPCGGSLPSRAEKKLRPYLPRKGMELPDELVAQRAAQHKISFLANHLVKRNEAHNYMFSFEFN